MTAVRPRLFVLSLAATLVATAALAHHRQTPPIVALTTSGDTSLPRSPAGRRLVIALGVSGRQIFVQHRKGGQNTLEQVTTRGDNANPTISQSGNVIAWDSDCALLGCPEPGRQIFMWAHGVTSQVTHDPTGSSVNPAFCLRATCLAFESHGDLAGANPAGTTQIFLYGTDGSLSQVSGGQGASHNAGVDRTGQRIVFDSTGDLSGADTGISQIWLLTPPGQTLFGMPSDPGGLQIITHGQGPSQRPAIDKDGHVVAFESTADLTGDQHDTQVSQIFLYDVAMGTLTPVTNDPGGCAGASVNPTLAGRFGGGTFSIGYTCHGQGYFFQYGVGLGKHFQLPINGGDTVQVAALGSWFRVVSTTANMLGSGTTSGHQIYMLNLFKLPVTPLD